MAKLDAAADDQEKCEQDYFDESDPEHVAQGVHLYELHCADKNDQHVDDYGNRTEACHRLSVFLSVPPMSFEHVEGVEVRVVGLVALESAHA